MSDLQQQTTCVLTLKVSTELIEYIFQVTKQEPSYCKQIVRQLRTQCVQGIYRPNYPVTLKSKLRVTVFSAPVAGDPVEFREAV